MSELFLTILNISITAGYMALATIVLRLLLKRRPKWITCILWALVAVRLIVPFSFESRLSLVPSAEPIKSETVISSKDFSDNSYEVLKPQTPVIEQESPDTPDSPLIEQETPDKDTNSPAENIIPDASDNSSFKETNQENNVAKVFTILSYVWAGGVLCMLTYSVISFVRLKRRVRVSVPCDKNIYICDDIRTPFILGIIKPRIYLPSALSEDELRYIISHEKAHLKRLDHLWKPLGFLLLSVHWFNPLMWVSYILLCRDIELACDEKVLKSLGTDNKKQYSQTLLNFSTERRLVSSCPLAFGEVGVKQRIRNILNYKKPAFWVTLLCLLLCLAIGFCFLTNPVTDKDKKDDETLLQNGKSFRIKATELIYDNPIFSYVQDANDAPIYLLVNGSQLQEVALRSDNTGKKLIGDIHTTELYASFDSTFYFGNDGFSDGYSIEFLRENNLYTICAENDSFYYQLLKQKDDTYYLVVGHIPDPEAPTPDEALYSDYTPVTSQSDRFIRWIYKVDVTEATPPFEDKAVFEIELTRTSQDREEVIPYTYEEIIETIIAAHPWKEYNGSSPLPDFPYASYKYISHNELSEIGYALIDIDSNGVAELLITSMDQKYVYDAYTIIDGKTVHLFTSGDRYFHTLFEGGYIQLTWSGGSTLSGHDFMKLSNGKIEFIERITIDAWYAEELGLIKEDHTDMELDDVSFKSKSENKEDYVHITYEELTHILNSYRQRNELEYTLTPLSEYKSGDIKTDSYGNRQPGYNLVSADFTFSKSEDSYRIHNMDLESATH